MPDISRYWTIVCQPAKDLQDVVTIAAIVQQCPTAVYKHKPDGEPEHIHLFISLPRGRSAEWLGNLAQVNSLRFNCVHNPVAFLEYLKQEEKKHGSFNPA